MEILHTNNTPEVLPPPALLCAPRCETFFQEEEDMADDITTYCLNQLYRPRQHFGFAAKPGSGNCVICTRDPINNPYCTKYTPITLYRRTTRTTEEPICDSNNIR